MKLRLLYVLAVLCSLWNCSSDYEILPSVEQIVLTADQSSKVIGQTIHFTVTNAQGQDLSGETVLYVDGIPHEGFALQSTEVGSHTVYASYYGVQSQPLLVNFHDGSEINFVKRVLIEDYTGTWCGYCPRVAHAIDLVANVTDQFVAVGIHRVSSNPNHPSYDPYNFNTNELENIINVPGYPKGMLNRMTQWSYPEQENVAQAIAMTQGANPKLGLALDLTWEGEQLNLTVNSKFANNFSGLKLVVYVLENGLVYDQVNYTEFYGGANPLPNYTHNHVLRGLATALMGDTIPSEHTQLNQVYSRNFTHILPASVTNRENVEVVAFITDAAGNVLNVRKAAPGEHQAFEEM